MDTLTLLIPLHYAALGASLAAAATLTRRRHGTAFAALLLAAGLVVASVIVLAFPFWANLYPSNPSTLLYAGTSTLLLAAAAASMALLPTAATRRLLDDLRGNEGAKRAAVIAFGAIVPLGMLEATAQVATRLGLVPYFVPVETRLATQSEDWRLAHVMSDSFREPDPVLLWRSVARYPYSSQRFKGPEIAVPKPAGTVRLICYGDSNTDGPSLGRAWPARLEALLDERRGPGAPRFEVVNAGVAGYSSYQGLARFEQEADRFTPDLILVSFGWNDAAVAIGAPDKEFGPRFVLPIANVDEVFLRRAAFGYRSVLVARHFFSPEPEPEAPAGHARSPRVSLADYESNLRAFASAARRRGIEPVLLTRPHRESPVALRRAPTWRRHVPDYGESTLRVARETGALAIDVAGAFDGHPELFADECHLTTAGHRAMATFVAGALAAAGLVD